MDPISGGAVSQVNQQFIQQAEQQLEKSNQQVSDFEKLRQKLEEQDAISSPQMEQINQANRVQEVSQANQVGQIDGVQKADNVNAMEKVTGIKEMGELENMVNNIRGGQVRLNEILGDLTSGKTYSPQEMMAVMMEAQNITRELSLMTETLKGSLEMTKTVLNIQF